MDFIKKNYKENIPYPSFCILNSSLFLEENTNNWLAVIAGGAYLAAKFINNKGAEVKARDCIKKYLAASFENDGSYGEGQQYLLYPIGRLMPAFVSMSKKERQDVFLSSSVRNAGNYLPYSSLFFNFAKKPVRIQFRDGQQISPIDSVALYFMALVGQDGIIYSFAQKFRRNQPVFLPHYTFLLQDIGTLPEPIPLENLPTVQTFENGECYIRINWTGDGIVFGLLSGGKTKTGFSHDRPARNGIALGAYGEYLLVTPGHSSYRGETYLNNDSATHGNNTVTINRKNQLFPRKKSDLDQYGIPEAKVLATVSTNTSDIIISDASGCYAEKPRHALRAAVFVKDPGYFVIFDQIDGGDSLHQFDSYWHFNNLDNAAQLSVSGKNSWILKRPKARLHTFSRSDTDLKARMSPAIMHYYYSYKPGGAGEGKPGSAKLLQLSSAKNVREWKVATLLFPEKSTQPSRSINVSGTGSKLEIRLGTRLDIIQFIDGKIINHIDIKNQHKKHPHMETTRKTSF